jgi:hypothetical protein
VSVDRLALCGLGRVKVADRDVHAVFPVGPWKRRVLLGQEEEREEVRGAEDEADPADGDQSVHKTAACPEDVGRRVGSVDARVNAVSAKDRVRYCDAEKEKGEDGRHRQDRLGFQRRRP